ncbi:cytochrome c oxidase assembly protein subunit 15 [Scopulibacillus darangshiensis]|uniref:Heme A synthase n=1 Tax=Scopulibacillus darangshiensis TaxID=442528 RepID=A0A4R2P6M7_9BACL|nr:heme A synthase [Scopulibacillus darangshiensis]TCP30503.1 cytochrome c oxidase assembly protein subunit 15 [Scopulibacillus darangshiensis]
MDRILRWLSVLTSFVVLLVVLMGALVTNTGSADGCGATWPLCYGEVIPTGAHKETMIEFSHRAVAGLAGILVVVQAVWACIKFPKRKEIKFMTISSVFFIVLQALMGAAAVIWSQSSIVLALHFGISLLSFASTLLLTILIFEELSFRKRMIPDISKGMTWNYILLSLYSYIVIYSGAFVRHTDSSLGCLDFPRCNGEWVPDLYSRAGIQYIHRTLAGLIVIWLLITIIIVLLRYKREGYVLNGTLIAFLCVVLQAISGVIVIYSRMELPFVLMHSLFVTCFFATLTFVVMIALRRKEKRY